MADDVNFLDLACLLRITPDTTLEKLSSAINANFFDASNLAGTLKQKGLIDFSSYYPGPNTIVISEVGKTLIAEADGRSTEQFDNLDQEILFQLSGGKRLPLELQNTLNIRSKDLALRLYKLFKQGFIVYDLKSGTVGLQLTENGFIRAKANQPQAPAAATAPAPQPDAQQQAAAPAPAATDQPIKLQPKPMSQTTMVIIALVVVAIVALAALHFYLHII
jgi:hypothetical protein